MNYQVLARKWRPHNFTEVVGQEHVVKSLINALQHNRLHHAYLFTGTRGVGKTTIARILAKAMNCENLHDANPCGVCKVCRDLDEGRFLDLIEVDAASRTKVEDTRDLLDNAQYAPNQGRYKVYLIDEVHMLSGHSFNALLKTLEEPPPHVKFLLATTDPHKIPVTVLSRCLQFNLKRLTPSQILAQMEFILHEEKITFETAALKLLARSADGSMRDGLSLLDQAIVFGNGKVASEDVNAMLGMVAEQPVEDLLTALARADAVTILDKINDIANTQSDFGEVLQQILQVLHRIALVQHLPTAIDPDFDTEMLTTLAALLSPEDVQLYYQIALIGQRDLDLAPDSRSGFEMLMLRMLTFKPVTDEPVTNKPASLAVAKTVAPPTTVTASTLPPVVATPVQQTSSSNDWASIITQLNLNGPGKALANDCALEYMDDKVCSLFIDSDRIRGALAEDMLQKALQAYRGTAIKLVFNSQKVALDTPAVQLLKAREDKQQAAIDNINADENIQALKAHFDARILPDTIEPI
ncbi:MAG: DNA polymerase III subunit gamma/tau [Methylococcaceae bacterium]|nr:DNA polymerase III subunit gamma/tau [Methylococcaceae bacterium]